MSTAEQIQVRKNVIVAMLPNQRERSIHAVISDAATVVAWIETGNELKSPEPSTDD